MRPLLAVGLALVTGCAAVPPVVATRVTDKQAHARGCTAASDCELVARTCCGHCGQPASGDVRAIARGTARQSSRCVGTGCPRCHADPDPALVAYCAAGTCRALDLHTSPLTRCAHDEECSVRPRSCCECDATEWVAIRTDAARTYQRRVCGGAAACPECAGPSAPHRAFCIDSRCVLRPITGHDTVE